MQAQSWLDNLSTRYRFRGGIPNTAVFNTFSSGLNRIEKISLSAQLCYSYKPHKGGFFSSEKKWQEKEVTTLQLLFYKNSKCII